jgi:hypothetical protein
MVSNTLARYRLIAILSLILALLSALISAQAATQPDVRSSGSETANMPLVDTVEQYATFEVSFPVDTVATNPYFPYDAKPPPGVEPGTGVTVDMLLLPPGEQHWANARVLPCFYYQPVEEQGTGGNAALLPIGAPEWRARFTPEIAGEWHYKIRIVDASGTSEGPVQRFMVMASNRKGFIRVSQTDPRFFEFSDGTPFVTPLRVHKRIISGTCGMMQPSWKGLQDDDIRN